MGFTGTFGNMMKWAEGTGTGGYGALEHSSRFTESFCFLVGFLVHDLMEFAATVSASTIKIVSIR